ncbi:uncharacterized protein LOC112087525 [Eutrema salsugineum]|uniref:uncharacterized protein LOC112087525 n=1 Tax=Eutrema salsugineum TaxID=72664 RepID=UPI000CED0605|nr:uncharacterized protein LOC112087525 [Eutrema salsugineum]
MLQHKTMLVDFLRCVVRDGKTASFWFDYWTDLGPLHTIFGATGTRQLRLRISASVACATRNDGWHLPNARSQDAQTLQIVLSTVTPPNPDNGPDFYLWHGASGSYVNHFSSRATWNHIRITSPTVSWHKTVWFKEQIPRCSFISWLAMLHRLPTKDRLLRWGVNVDGSCVLCNSALENHDHLFFHCPFSSEIWLFFSRRLWNGSPQGLHAVADWVGHRSSSGAAGTQVITKLVFQAVLYSVWRERNARIFSATSSPVLVVHAAVDRMIRDRLLSFPARSLSYPSLLELYFSLLVP